MKYLVIEIQTNLDGTIGNSVFAYDNRNEAEAKMHNLLSVAAVSSLPRHAVVLLDNAGSRLGGDCYVHDVQVNE